MPQTAVLTAVSMIAFAANSVLARMALGTGDIDALAYTGTRLVAGALTLAVLFWWTSRRRERANFHIAGSWYQAAALFSYALAFSVSYLMLGASTGALVLFGSVQLGMLSRAIFIGDRPGVWEWTGLAIAFAALAFLVWPGIAAPDTLGVVLMVAAGLSWAAYSLLGRGSTSPLADTSGNFIRCVPAAAILAVLGLMLQQPSMTGLLYAAASGAIASGLGYAVWYTALPRLSRSRAAIVQLSVPVLAGIGAVLFIGEALTFRLVIASIAVIGGVGLAIIAGDRRQALAKTGAT